MKNIVFPILLLLFGLDIKAQNKNFHDFTLHTIEGESYPLSKLKGKKVMVVNTASKCGLTPQYKELEDLYKTFGGEKFVIIGIPANNFLRQEPGTNEEIKEFCTKNYGVSFPMMEKISVKGDDVHPLYVWLTQKKQNGVLDSEVKWNFQKYLIDADGKLVDVVFPKESPKSEKVLKWIKG